METSIFWISLLGLIISGVAVWLHLGRNRLAKQALEHNREVERRRVEPQFTIRSGSGSRNLSKDEKDRTINHPLQIKNERDFPVDVKAISISYEISGRQSITKPYGSHRFGPKEIYSVTFEAIVPANVDESELEQAKRTIKLECKDPLTPGQAVTIELPF